MLVNILIAVENTIDGFGLESIIRNEIFGIEVYRGSKDEVVKRIQQIKFDIAIVEVKKNESKNCVVLKALEESHSKPKVVAFLTERCSKDVYQFIKHQKMIYILHHYNSKEIVSKVKECLESINLKKVFSNYKLAKLNTIGRLLSKRELEISLMLIEGRSVSEISTTKNLAISTISTYKRRIFEKTKVKNIIEMSELFKRHELN